MPSAPHPSPLELWMPQPKVIWDSHQDFQTDADQTVSAGSLLKCSRIIPLFASVILPSFVKNGQ